MYMKGTHLVLSILLTATCWSTYCNAQGEKSRIRPVIPYEQERLAAPPGMVYVPGGTTIIKYSQQETDSNCVKKVSLSSFFIDKCEITNQQYRQFVYWVIDSLAITKYLNDDDKWFRDAKIADSALRVTTVRRINWARVDHKSLFENPDTRAKLLPMLDERGQIKRDSLLFNFVYLRASGTDPKAKVGSVASLTVNVYPDEEIWAKDLTNAQTDILVENYFTSPPYDDYPVVGVTWLQSRAFSYWRSITSNGYSEVADYMKNYHLAYSLPSEAQWVYAAQQDVKAANTMYAAAQNGTKEVSDKSDGKDKNAAADAKPKKKKKGGKKGTDSAAVVVAPVDQGSVVPTDANSSWTSSTSTTVDNSNKLAVDTVSFYDPTIPDEKTNISSDKNGLTANFKQGEGDYTGDGSPFTVPVMSYTPNDFGIYNMVGNVAEWCMDAYSPSTFAFVSDVNPVLLFDADSTEADPMRRKVVRGGSFLSNAKALSPFSREYYTQETAHCYIGFRCVMAAPEILTNVTATRRKSGRKSK
jgi:formylglycine-generating enzyme required for sulfatase activity